MNRPFSFKESNRAVASGVHGSALLLALGTITVISLVAASVCVVTMQRHRASFQDAGWSVALAAAEAGADIGIAALRAGTWTGWSNPDANGVRTYQTPALTNSGQGTASSSATIAIDCPAGFKSSAGTFYRIRSTGTAQLSGGRGYVTGDRLNNRLWRLSLKRDRNTGASVTGAGQVSRMVEVIARPNTLFPRAITLVNKITSNSSASFVDSFDSGDPTKSTGTLYDPAKRQQNGTIGTLNSNGSDLSNMPIYGDLLYSGPAVQNTAGVTGNIITPFEETLEPVKAPNWPIFNGNYGTVKNNLTLTSGPAGSPTRYIMDKLEYSSDTMTLVPPAPGQSGEIEIWVKGDLKMSGNSVIISQPDVRVTIYVGGDIDATGNSFMNLSNIAANMSILGVTPVPAGNRDIKFTGNADFTATIYAPDFDIKFGGNGSYTGAFVGKTLLIGGNNTEIHYDEALQRIGRGRQYKVASWIEDIR